MSIDMEREKKLAAVLLGGAFFLLMIWSTVEPALTQNDNEAPLPGEEKKMLVNSEASAQELELHAQESQQLDKDLEVLDKESLELSEEELQQLDKDLEGL